ncbi:hypothetical protein [Flavobacterium soli]|uniref:hypothetical protein n=1 Tax=Flavobacterium soli TaxID=344881 RepID=UPI000423AE29|nr:hypothetical protein [Flavobacterium soli]
MKKIILIVGFGLVFLNTQEVAAQQGFGTNQPDKSAAVDIVSTKRGLLIPRIALTATNVPGPVADPANALFVYNTATTTGANQVEPGFYYWERDNAAAATPGKWVRFVSSNSEKNVIVEAGNNVKVEEDDTTPNTTKYTVSVQGGTNGQVLVTEVVAGVTSTKWINPEDFVSDVIDAQNGLTYVPSTGPGVDNIIKLGGTLTEPTQITTDATNTFSINGLATVTPTATDFILVMDATGVLKKTTASDLLDAKDLNLAGSELEFTVGDGEGAVLKATTIGIKDASVGVGKFDPGTATEGQVATIVGSGATKEVVYADAATSFGEDLTTDGKIVIGSAEASTLANAVLVATDLRIKAESITSTEIKNGTIQASDIKAPGTATESSTGGTANQVMVTNATGDVSWINQSDLGNKDSYTGLAPITIAANGTSTNGINYNVSIEPASGTDLGVVKQVATNPTIDINSDGELSVNLTNTILSGDVTGPLNDTNVSAIQGTGVSATAPTTTNNVLKFDGTNWTPAKLDASDITGEAITSSTLTISADGASAVLKDITIDITPSTTAGTILTTVDNAGTLETSWETPNSLVEVDNGLRKVTDDVIHLGGALIEPTTIATGATNTLAITNLTEVASANKVVVAETSGVLRTVTKSVSQSITADLTIDNTSVTNYSPYVQEVNISATVGASDIDVTLPSPSAENNGQTVNIKIENTTEPDFYLNVRVSGGVLLTYGSMPYQGWVIKSNGTAWTVVGRN